MPLETITFFIVMAFIVGVVAPFVFAPFRKMYLTYTNSPKRLRQLLPAHEEITPRGLLTGPVEHDAATARFAEVAAQYAAAKRGADRQRALLLLLSLPCPPGHEETREQARQHLAAWPPLRLDGLRDAMDSSLVSLLGWRRELDALRHDKLAIERRFPRIATLDADMVARDEHEDPDYEEALSGALHEELHYLHGGMHGVGRFGRIVRMMLERTPPERWTRLLLHITHHDLRRESMSITRQLIEHAHKRDEAMTRDWVEAHAGDETLSPMIRMRLVDHYRERFDASALGTLQGGQLTLSVDPETTGALSLSDDADAGALSMTDV